MYQEIVAARIKSVQTKGKKKGQTGQKKGANGAKKRPKKNKMKKRVIKGQKREKDDKKGKKRPKKQKGAKKGVKTRTNISFRKLSCNINSFMLSKEMKRANNRYSYCKISWDILRGLLIFSYY